MKTTNRYLLVTYWILMLSFVPLSVLGVSNIDVTVVSASGSRPIPGAVVRWKGSEYGKITDGMGKVSIQRSDSLYYLLVESLGYEKDTIFISSADEEIEVRLKEADISDYQLAEVDVEAEGNSVKWPTLGALQVETISSLDLQRAACCNLGESFNQSPSVDVSYNDGTTGAKQIKLLGLSSVYVQMLTENIPNFRGASVPFALGYIPGTWMKSIQVSKGCSSVKNGSEAITGQINIEYLKPQDDEELNVNLFLDSHLKWEANADVNFHLNDHLSTALLVHYEDQSVGHDMNEDGFYDMPKTRQENIMNRWMYRKNRYIMQSGLKVLGERRIGGEFDNSDSEDDSLYSVNVNTQRYELFTKNAFVLDYEHNANIAVVFSGSLHQQKSKYGNRLYNVDESDVYGALFFETEFTRGHKFSTGYNFVYEGLNQRYNLHQDMDDNVKLKEKESLHGLYAQYTFNHHEEIVAIVGVRGEYRYDSVFYFTPRFHFKWMHSKIFSSRLSIGRGYRSPKILAENSYLLASNRKIQILERIKMEEAWNFGISEAFHIPLFDEHLTLNLDYYYTHFINQMVIDMDADPHAVLFYNLNGRAYSHTFQVDVSYPLPIGFSISAAYRYNDVKTTYSGDLRNRPLTSRYKGLMTLEYKTPLELWQVDVTCQLNGSGRMPDPYREEDGTLSWEKKFHAYPQLSAQVTRLFRWGALYLGGENLTNFKQRLPIIDSSNPWGEKFDATMIWGPIDGIMAYVGVRYKFHNHK